MIEGTEVPAPLRPNGVYNFQIEENTTPSTPFNLIV